MEGNNTTNYVPGTEEVIPEGMTAAISFDADTFVAEDVPDVSKIIPGETIYEGGVSINKKGIRTAVYVENTHDAEEVCDKIFRMTSVHQLLSAGKAGDTHLPVKDIESGEYITEGNFLRLFDTSACKVVISGEQDNSDSDELIVISHLKVLDDEELELYEGGMGQWLKENCTDTESGNVVVYVEAIYVSSWLIIQLMSDGTVSHTIIKDRIPSPYVVVEV
jgi:hypothetical protein